MFVLLEHTTRTGVHWDFLVEVAGCEGLPTWRLHDNPLTTADEIPAEQIFDHRREFLEYEGPLRGERGSVRRVDHGPATVARFEPPELLVLLEGQRLRGVFDIVARGGMVVFQGRVSPEPK